MTTNKTTTAVTITMKTSVTVTTTKRTTAMTITMKTSVNDNNYDGDGNNNDKQGLAFRVYILVFWVWGF
jgi:hypothetical protein